MTEILKQRGSVFVKFQILICDTRTVIFSYCQLFLTVFTFCFCLCPPSKQTSSLTSSILFFFLSLSNLSLTRIYKTHNTHTQVH